MTQRDRIFLNSKLLEQTENGYKCQICGALCKTPGDGHAPDCVLDSTVSEVAPKETAEELMTRLRMEAMDKLSGEEMDKCHELTNLLMYADEDEREDALKKVSEFCGKEAVADGVLRGFSALSVHPTAYQQIVTRLMCERMWFLEAAKQPVTPPVK